MTKEEAYIKYKEIYDFAGIGKDVEAIVDINFIKISIAGPAVSLKGSPTVSPVTAAL